MQKINTIRAFLTMIFLAIMIWGAVLQLIPDKNTIWNYFFNFELCLVFLVGGFINLWYPSKMKITGNPRKVLDFLGFSLVTYGIGLAIWTYYNFAFGESIPYPSFPDAFFVVFYPLIFITTFLFFKLFSFLITEKIIRQAIIISVIMSVIILGVFIRPEISENVSFWANILNVYYPLTSAITLTLALTTIKVSGGESTKSAIWLSLGLLMHGLSTFFFSFRTATGTYWNGDFSDILLATSAYLIAMAGINIIASLIPNKDSY